MKRPYSVATLSPFLLAALAYPVGSFAETSGVVVPHEITIPSSLPEPAADGTIYINPKSSANHAPGDMDGEVALTIDGHLQAHLTDFINDRNDPIAAVVVAEVATGKILAMVQGRQPALWGAATHSALHTSFPAASLFKTVVSAAALELAELDEHALMGLSGGCAQVRENGAWLKNQVAGRQNMMTLKRAFGKSCNGYFAKIGVSEVGLGPIMNFAQRFGWGRHLASDFMLEPSVLKAPVPESSSAHTVGRFAAGFGQVGISPVHAAWMMLALANDGVAKPLQIVANNKSAPANAPAANATEQRLVSVETAGRLRSMMNETVRGGTASFAFRPAKFRDLRAFIGGKTGTLTGAAPKGLTTWFTGMMPLEKPEIVVAAVVILDRNRWHIKGPSLAAEAFWAYHDLKRGRHLTSTQDLPVAKNIP